MTARIPQEVREQQIAELCEGTIYSFVGWKDEYLRNTSNIVCSYSVHGNWVCRLADFINGSRCRKCANEKFSLERRHGVDVWRKRIEDGIAKLEGFQGCTEWLKWNPAIPLWFKYLNG